MDGKSILKQVLVTMLTMYSLNLLAASVPQTRKIIKGESSFLERIFG